MKLPELFDLIKQFEAGSLLRLEYETEEGRVVLEKGGQPVVSSAPVPAPAAVSAPAVTAESQAEVLYIRTPLVGSFYVASEPGKPPFVKPGDRVKKGQTVCVIEAMKMINEVPAPCDCLIEKALPRDGALVGFDEPLFEIREL